MLLKICGRLTVVIDCGIIPAKSSDKGKEGNYLWH
jgi:hypothetical protein